MFYVSFLAVTDLPRSAGNDVLETDTEYDKLTITHMSTPERPNRSLNDSGMDIRATQAGVGQLICFVRLASASRTMHRC